LIFVQLSFALLPAMPGTYDYRSEMPASAEDVFVWHARPAAFLRIQPPWEPVEIVSKHGAFGDGHRVTFRMSLLGPAHTTWTAELHDVEPGRRFVDRQVSGPFASWDHAHTMTPAGPGRSTLAEHVEYRLPLWGRVGSGLVRRRLTAMFAYRHAVTASDLRRLAKSSARPAVAVTGSRGLVGTELTHFLTTGGYPVVRFVRGDPKPAAWDDGTRSVKWDPDAAVDPSALEGVGAVVHLAGENIGAGRWNESRKRLIRESRTGPTRRLAEAAAKAGVKVLVSASAVGVYGDRGDEELDESSPPGPGFLADVCKAWEEATEPAERAGVRVVHLRIGIVLSPKGAALGEQLPAFRAGAGAVLGTGKQWLAWITVNDLVGAVHHALVTEPLAGPVNATAPHPATNREFGRTLARVLRRPYLMTLPRPALRLTFGEFADATLLASMKARPRKLEASGFAFDHPELEPALRFLLGRV
jgi:uncharacterized protein (TIGR01777 family)